MVSPFSSLAVLPQVRETRDVSTVPPPGSLPCREMLLKVPETWKLLVGFPSCLLGASVIPGRKA